MSWPQLQILGQVLRAEFGPDQTLGTTVEDLMDRLAERGVHVSRETVVGELRAATGGEYDNLPADKKWAPMFYYDEKEGHIGALL